MNYRHIYHAGNFADVFKHVLLTLVLEKMTHKSKGFTVLDAFAGIGLYDLNSDESIKTNEALNGVTKLFKNYDKILAFKKNENNLHSAVKAYRDIISHFQNIISDVVAYNKKTASFYFGSPVITSYFLRKQDRLICVEKHEKDYCVLKTNLKNLEIKATIHNMSAYDAIKGMSFQTSRGLIVIDPAFEIKDEFEMIIDTLKFIKSRYISTPIFIWYPIKDMNVVDTFYSKIRGLGYKESLIVEFGYDSDVSNKIGENINGLTKCGVLVLNPPDIVRDLDLILQNLSLLLYNSDNLNYGKIIL